MDGKMNNEKMERSSGSETLEGAHNGASSTLSRTVLFKMDVRILPVLALLFLCSFIDRTNVGNAKILGLQKAIHINDHQYAIGLCVFYATYIASELPSNLLLRKISPKIWLPTLTALWGTLTMCLGFVHSFASFATVRALLGVAEGGLLPGMVLYLSLFYRREELALRIGIFYTAASLSGAFGGLLARGLNAIGHAGGLQGWRWIFIVEGLITVAVGIGSAFLLPNSIEDANFLTIQEQEHARDRIGTAGSESERFSWDEVKRGIFNVQVWLSALAYFSILSGLYSFGLFLPTIVNNGYAKDPNQAQLWTVIPYAVATVFTVLVAFISDRLALRGPVMLCTLPVAIIGYGVISQATHPKVQYGMTFLMATGMYATVPCILSWNSNNSAGHYKRATTSALQLAIANAGGFVASFVYPKKEAPHFHKSHSIMLGLLCAAWVLIAANVAWVWKINKDKEKGKYAAWEGKGDDRDPAFKMVL